MRKNARQNSILNSPVVRSLIRPITISPLPPPPPTPAAPLPPPHPSELIPTQPPPLPISAPTPAPAPAPSPVVATNGSRPKRKLDQVEQDEEVSYTPATLPAELTKYWAQRYRLFSRFDEGIRMDREGWYSVTPEAIAVQIAERCRSGTVLDAFCGVGGNAIQFAMTCERVIALDTSSVRLSCAKHNATLYSASNIAFHLADFRAFARAYLAQRDAGTLDPEDVIEVVFLSPPWGGIEYRAAGAAKRARTLPPDNGDDEEDEDVAYPLSALAPEHGKALFLLARQITPNVAYYLPRNVDLAEVAALARARETVEVEEEWMSGKLKAVTAYFGELATKRR